MVNLFGNTFTVVTLFTDFPTEEDQFFFLPKYARSQLFAHTPARYHRSRNARYVFKVAGCTICYITEYNLFSSTTTQCTCNLIVIALGCAKCRVVFGHDPGYTTCHTTRHNRHFADRIAERQHMENNRMTCFMIGNYALFFFSDNAAATFGAKHYTLHRFFEVAHADALLVFTRSYNCSFVDKVLNICADKARCRFG